MSEGRRALVVSYSTIGSDPRVHRQIDWLTADGWVVDSLGLGETSSPDVARHFRLEDPPHWLLTRWGALAVELLPNRLRYRLLTSGTIPAELRAAVRAGGYDAVVLNELEFAPWVADARDFPPAARDALLHLDLHEYHDPRMRRRTLGGRIAARYYRWVRRHIADSAFTSRSVVNAPIGRLYVDELGIAPLTPVHNAPPAVDLDVRLPDGDEIKLLFHGLLSWQRGFAEILEAMRELPERFTMTFMLMPHRERLAALQAQIDAHPARDRIRIVPPAPMREIAPAVNGYDLEVIFYRPSGPNLLYALPNKFFEAVQGRLGVVVGESPAMADLVREHGNGIVVGGFEASDLAAALGALTREDVIALKQAADRAAGELNAEAEGRRFLAGLAAGARR